MVKGPAMKWFADNPNSADGAEKSPVGFDDFEVKLGDLMRGERATMGKSLLDVQRELHIRATYIAAIEAGDLSAFEAASFVAGYVRSYARYLGMDADWCYAKFCAETQFSINPEMQRGAKPSARTDSPVNQGFSQGMLSRTRMAAEPDPIWRRFEPMALGSITVLLVLIAGLGYGGWMVLQEVQRVNLTPADNPPDVLADLDPVTSGALPRMSEQEDSRLRSVVGLRDGASVAQGVVRNYRPEALDTPVITARDGPIVAIRPRDEDESIADPTLRSAVELALAEAQDPVIAPEQIRVTRDGPPQVEILAVRPSWIRVRAADGTVLFEKVLDAGERYTVPQSERPATLRAGNSGSVYMLVDGEPFGPTAPGAQVVDQIALSPDAVTDRFSVADLSGDQDLRNFVAIAESTN